MASDFAFSGVTTFFSFLFSFFFFIFFYLLLLVRVWNPDGFHRAVTIEVTTDEHMAKSH